MLYTQPIVQYIGRPIFLTLEKITKLIKKNPNYFHFRWIENISSLFCILVSENLTMKQE